jgi:Kef-type K+ transport system membrane component KefB
VESTWIALLALSAVSIVALLFAQALARWAIPEVLAYLVVGIVLGPEILGVLSVGVLDRTAFLPQVLLGFVAFMLGEYLAPRALLNRKTLPITTGVLSVLLPLAVVMYGVTAWAGAPVREAIVLGIFAMAGAPATVLAIRQTLGDRSGLGGLLATLAALDNLLVVLVYATLAPFLAASVTAEWTVWSALWEVVLTIGAGTVVGLLGARTLERLRIANPGSAGATMAGSLFVIVALVASTWLLGSSPLVACAVAGLVTASREETIPRSDHTACSALRPLEHLVYVLFFVFAGTEIVFGHLTAAGVIAVVYILGRSLGKIAAAVLGGIRTKRSMPASLRFGAALLPQAGVVVGLALDAGARFPYVGADIVAVVLAALIVFEFVGPVAVQKALLSAGE